MIGAAVGLLVGAAIALGIVLGVPVHDPAASFLIGIGCGYGFSTLGLIVSPR